MRSGKGRPGSELPLDTQATLLRVLPEHEFDPIGSNDKRPVDVRVIAATNRDLRQAMAEGRFRSDLFYRVNVLPIHMPALRERRADIPLLVQFLVERFARQMAKRIDCVSRQTMDEQMAYDWPGNVRELQNVILGVLERCAWVIEGPRGGAPPRAAAEHAAQPHQETRPAAAAVSASFPRPCPC